MKNFFLSLTFLLSAHSALAAVPKVECSVSNQTVQIINGEIVIVGDKFNVPVEILDLSIPPGLSYPPVQIGSSQVRVRYSLGNEFEKQSYLQMFFDDFTSTIYDVKDSLYSLEMRGVHFQCLVSGSI